MAAYTEQQRAYWMSAFACGPPANLIPSMRRYARGTIVASSSAVTLAQYRAQCVSANQQPYTPPDPITSDYAEPVADNYIIQQRFLIRIPMGSARWELATVTMPNGCDDGFALFLLRSNKVGTISASIVGTARQHTYSPGSVTVTTGAIAVTDAVWGAADSDGDTWVMLEAYFIEASGGQHGVWQFGYRPAGGVSTTPAFVNKAGGVPTETA